MNSKILFVFKAVIKILFLVVCMARINVCDANAVFDSLVELANKETDQIKRVNRILEFSERYCQENTLLSKELADLALRISQTNNYELGIAKSNYGISRYYITKGDVEKSLEIINNVIESFEKNQNLIDLAHAYSLKSIMLGRLLQYDNAIELLLKAIKLFEQENDRNGVHKSMLNLAMEYINIKQYDKSLVVLDGVSKLQGTDDIQSDKFYLPVNYGSLYFELGDYSKALEYFLKALDGAKALKIPDAEVSSLHAIGMCYHQLINYKKALVYYQEANKLAAAHQLVDERILILKDLANLYQNMEDYKGAFNSYQLYISLRDTAYNLDKINRIADLEKSLEVEKREHVIKLKNSEIEKGKAEIDAGRYKVYGASAGTILLLLVSVIVFKSYKKTQKLNSEILIQKLKVEEKNKDVMESINYAKRIQSSILLSDAQLSHVFKSYFVFYKPKDIVSGDFYWVFKTSHNKIIFTVADCTGHGVPGALMSMVGNSLLNEIVIENEVDKADEILNELKAGLIKTLGQETEGKSKDGMDMALCVLDTATNVLEYAGANNSVYVVKKSIDNLEDLCEQNSHFKNCGNGLLELKADKQSVAFEEEKNNKFTAKTVQLELGDTIYLFSDGYADQFGGPRNKKITYRKFKDVISRLSELPLDKQKEELGNDFNSWMANNEQVDDVCVMGIQI